MRIRRAHLTGFGGLADTALDFGDGVNVILAADGAADTVLEGVAWALLGAAAGAGAATLRDARGDASDATCVALHVEHAGAAYELKRELCGAAADSGREAVAALRAEVFEAERRLDALASAPDLLAQYSRELERLRPELATAEAAEERLHDEWSQKRQDVETRLDAYHRRAAELKQQMERLAGAGTTGACPTCSQTLGSGAGRLLEALEDEYYISTQDMKWLVQRRSQLAEKPVDLVAAETRRARLRAAVDDRTERVARCEQAVQELWTVATERKRASERLRSLDTCAADASSVIVTSGATPRAASLPLLLNEPFGDVPDAELAAAIRSLRAAAPQVIVATRRPSLARLADHSIEL